MEDNIFDKVHEVDLKQTMETSYIDYAMSVIASRALPDVSRTESVRVSSVIRWVNITRTVTALSMVHWLIWHRNGLPDIRW